MLTCRFVEHLGSQVLGHEWSWTSSPLFSLPRSPPCHPWHGTPGCVQYSVCCVCSLHRGQRLVMAGEGDAPSPLLILCSLTGNSFAWSWAPESESIGGIVAKPWVDGFWGGEVGNERLSVSPVLTIVGCSHLTAQETASSAVSFMSTGRSNHSPGRR